jgi:PAS domain S-box-containing protein
MATAIDSDRKRRESEQRHTLAIDEANTTLRDVMFSLLADQRAQDARQVLEKLVVPGLVVGADGRPLTANTAAESFLGRREDELQALPFPDFTLPQFVNADVAQFNELNDGHIPGYTFFKQWYRSDGAVVSGMMFVTSYGEGATLVFILPVSSTPDPTG